MKVFIRNELDVDSPVNLRRLPPFMKIYAGLMTKVHESRFYKTRMQKKMEAAYLEQIRYDEMLKDAILAILYRELHNNLTLEKRGKLCREVILSVASEYKKPLMRILDHKDFIDYDIELIKEQHDIRRAFRDMPVLIRVSKKSI